MDGRGRTIGYMIACAARSFGGLAFIVPQCRGAADNKIYGD